MVPGQADFRIVQVLNNLKKIKFIPIQKDSYEIYIYIYNIPTNC